MRGSEAFLRISNPPPVPCGGGQMWTVAVLPSMRRAAGVTHHGGGSPMWAEALWHSVLKIHPGEALDRRRDFPPLRHFVPTYLVTHRVRLARISESSAPFETAEAELEADGSELVAGHSDHGSSFAGPSRPRTLGSPYLATGVYRKAGIPPSRSAADYSKGKSMVRRGRRPTLRIPRPTAQRAAALPFTRWPTLAPSKGLPTVPNMRPMVAGWTA